MKLFVTLASAMLLALTAASPAHASWTRSYVISWYEPAMYFGGKTNALEPGTDCPKGGSTQVDWVQVLVDAGYTREQAQWLRNPANPTYNVVGGQRQMAFRGKNRENVYDNPTSTPEVGLPPMEGKIAEGLDLDDNPSTGFISPTGQRGIDNNFYRALGCWKTYRGAAHNSYNALGFNEQMRSGAWTAVIVITGQGKDPMNDNKVTVGIYASPDKIVLTPLGDVNPDFSFRIRPDQKQEGILTGRTVKGHIITGAIPELTLHDSDLFNTLTHYNNDLLQLLRARADLQMTPNGELEGFIGGYIPWRQIYDLYAHTGTPAESITWERVPDVFYALRRYADYSPTGPKGEKTHISYAVRVSAKPAFVMKPDGTALETAAASYRSIAKPYAIDVPERYRNLKPLEPLPEDQLLPPKGTKVTAAEQGTRPQ